jgi:hypothetical protein
VQDGYTKELHSAIGLVSQDASLVLGRYCQTSKPIKRSSPNIMSTDTPWTPTSVAYINLLSPSLTKNSTDALMPMLGSQNMRRASMRSFDALPEAVSNSVVQLVLNGFYLVK